MPEPPTADVHAADPRFLIETTESHHFISAIDVSLTQAMLPAARHLVVRAFEVRIEEPLRLPGRCVEIYAHTVRGSAKAEIDITPEAPPEHGPAELRNQPGQDGASGKDGEPGGDCGDVRILARRIVGKLKVCANGADGGVGQEGGNGVQGGAGGVGRDASGGSEGFHPGSRGGAGGRGGSAGTGGRGGDGGAGGSIEIGTIEPVRRADLTLVSEGGDGGPGGNHGRAAPGGPGGIGGWNRECREIEPPRGGIR